jgi:hypothetical protein
MKSVLASITFAFLASSAVAAEQGATASPAPPEAAKPDVCAYTSRDWSAMREVLVAVSQFRGKNEADVQQIARQALAGSPKFSIGVFELRFKRGRSVAAAPNAEVCFAEKATFSAVRNDGNDAAYECEATMDMKGKLLSVSCKLVAG